jgi:hypothetical protein
LIARSEPTHFVHVRALLEAHRGADAPKMLTKRAVLVSLLRTACRISCATASILTCRRVRFRWKTKSRCRHARLLTARSTSISTQRLLYSPKMSVVAVVVIIIIIITHNVFQKTKKHIG